MNTTRDTQNESGVIRKNRGKSKPIRIDSSVQNKVRKFKIRLQEMSDNNEVRLIDNKVISYILNNLDDYDANILIAYYDIAECSPTALGKMMGVSASVITSRIKKIIKKIQIDCCKI